MTLSGQEYRLLDLILVGLLTPLQGRLGETPRRRLLWSVPLAQSVAVAVNAENVPLGNGFVLAAAVAGGAKAASLLSAGSALVSGTVAALITDNVSFTVGRCDACFRASIWSTGHASTTS